MEPFKYYFIDHRKLHVDVHMAVIGRFTVYLYFLNDLSIFRVSRIICIGYTELPGYRFL